MMPVQMRSLYLFAKDLPATLAFYRLLGLPVEDVSDSFARVEMPNGMLLQFGTSELTRSYFPGWTEPSGSATNTINFELPSDKAVDEVYAAIIAAGHSSLLSPCDPPWQSRFAIVEDPNGNSIGLNGPNSLDEDRQRELKDVGL